MRRSLAIAVIAAGQTGVHVPTLRAQSAADSLARCDSIIAESRADSVEAGLFISVRRSDGGRLGPEQAAALESSIGSAFVAPRPFKLTVFGGPALIPALRPARAAGPELRAPTVTGTYRVTSTARGALSPPKVVRAALAPGFDSAAMRAITDVAFLRSLFVPPRGADSMRLDIRFSTDSIAGAVRLVTTHFPRMPVVDAAPPRDNPPPAFPDEARADSLTTGEVVLRIVIDQGGAPRLDAAEVVSATSTAFVRAALESLVAQRFRPATIGGCAVPQLVEYPLSFLLPQAPARRH